MSNHLILPQFTRGESLQAQNVLDLVGANAAPLDLPAVKASLMEAGIDEASAELMLKSWVEKTITDPVVLQQPYVVPVDFAAQYPQPLDPTEVLTLCEEINVYNALPEVVTAFNGDYWREMDELEMSGDGDTNEGFFLKGSCPDTHQHDGDNRSVTRRHLGDQKTLALEDIKHSAAVAGMDGLGISAISTQQRRAQVADLKAKEMLLMEILVLNNFDRALVSGNNALNALAFDGIETQVTSAGGARINADPTGTFDVEKFDQFLTAGCARPTHIFGHPMSIRAIKLAYLQLGAASAQGPIMQVVVSKDGNSMVPGFTMADMIDTAVGRLVLVPDFRFTAIQVQPDRFHSAVYPLRLYHNGEPIVYKSTQTPLSFKDLNPGCTAISFMIYCVSALVIKHMCAQSLFTANWPGVIDTGCVIVNNT